MASEGRSACAAELARHCVNASQHKQQEADSEAAGCCRGQWAPCSAVREPIEPAPAAQRHPSTNQTTPTVAVQLVEAEGAAVAGAAQQRVRQVLPALLLDATRAEDGGQADIAHSEPGQLPAARSRRPAPDLSSQPTPRLPPSCTPSIGAGRRLRSHRLPHSRVSFPGARWRPASYLAELAKALAAASN